jgi:hypothetical protein
MPKCIRNEVNNIDTPISQGVVEFDQKERRQLPSPALSGSGETDARGTTTSVFRPHPDHQRPFSHL